MKTKFGINFFYLLIILGCVNIISCKKADINFGQEFLGESYVEIVKVDSFSTNLSTIYMDSFITNGRGVVMIGGYNDAQFGNITTQSYFEVLPATWADVYQNSFFDSITLVVRANGNFYGDTTKPVTIIAKELKDSIVFDDLRNNIYNNKTFNTKPGELGRTTVKIAPSTRQFISIRLNDTIGNYFFKELKNVNNVIFKNNDKFLNIFRGIQLSTDGTSEAIYNCSDDIIIRLHYKQNGVTPKLEQKFDFNLATRRKQFNNISIARTGAIQNINTTTNREISSALSGNAAYCQSATNTAIKISFNNLRSILQFPKFARILKAALVIKPLKGTYDKVYTLPPTLRLSETDANNKIQRDLAYLTPNGAASTQLGLLNIDFALQEKTQYQYDLTDFIKSEIANPSLAKGFGLILSPPSPDFENLFNRVVIGDNKKSIGNIRLDVYYATVK